MKKIKIYTQDEIQKVYERHHRHCGTVVYSKNGGTLWQSVPMDTGKWNEEHAEDAGKSWIKPWVYAFLEIIPDEV
jgi:hypothetical protein